ncbi:zinc ribbon domain-containing protein [Marvinbryantia formatexigens]|nr:zinc ribbon domain-containing protein [Marvinbryantia formatexigens]UWO23405.1 zinc ribbon domain-containing protein [Marvinbryantia formatexigens DSM 14469]SDG38403.1 zinc-ribbon domain-containing protein [Marvinbryantia formatexigens]
MYCPDCGHEIMDGDKFCRNCGREVIKYKNTVQGKQTKKTAHRKRGVPFKGLAVAAVLVVMAGGILYGAIITGVFGGKTDMSDYCVTISDGQYKLVPFKQNLREEEIVIAGLEWDSSGNDTWSYLNNDYAQLTEDGEYLYFFSKLSDYGATGNLYRAELGKLRPDSDKNDKYIVKIASDVETDGLFICKDGTAVYQKKESLDDNVSRLYYFDGERSASVARDVYISEVCGDYVFYTVSEDASEIYTLYGQMLGHEESERKIAAYTDGAFYIKDPEHIVYTKTRSDEYNSYCALYIAGYSAEPEKLSDNVCEGTWYNFSFEQTGSFYYTETGSEKVYMSDFVENPCADEDKEAVEPDYYDEKYDEDYAAYEADYEKYEMALERRDLMDYLSELSCGSKAYSLYYYDISVGEPVLISDWVDDYQISYQMAYSNKHSAIAYFKRPDTIRKLNIEQVQKEYDGTYSDAERIVMEYLNSNSANTDILYCTVDGSEEQGINLQDGSVGDVFEGENGAYFILGIYNEGNNLAFFGAEYDSAWNRTYSDDIYTVTVSDRKIGELESISATDAVSIGVYGDRLGYHDADGYFYMYINNKHIFVVEDECYSVNAKGYEDGSTLVWTDYMYENGGMLARISKTGEEELVAEEISRFRVLNDGKILYLIDDELRLYDGKEDEVVAGDTDYFWCLGMEEL